MAHDVFISYASQNKTVADALCAKMEAKHLRCWIAPRDMPPSRNYGAALVEAIQASSVFVLIFSAHANQSVHVPREVEQAVSKGVPVIPFRIEEVEPSKSLDYFIKSIHWLDALTPPLEKHLDRLTEKVQLLLGQRELEESALTSTTVAAKRKMPSASQRAPHQSAAPAREASEPALALPAGVDLSCRAKRRPVALALSAACILAAVLGLGLWLARDFLFAPTKKLETTNAATDRKFITNTMLLELVRDDLNAARNPTQRRYVTLTHLWNDPSIEPALLKEWQDALLAVGSYLGKNNPLLTPVNEAKTLYGIDWPTSHLPTWDQLLANDPYALIFVTHHNPELAEIARTIEHVAVSRRPYVRADWFVRQLSRLAKELPPWVKNRGPFPDDLGRLLRTWEGRPVQLATAAADLGWPDTTRLLEKIQGSTLLAEKMGMRALVQDGQVSRSMWESREWVLSPFQELGRLEGCGYPVVEE